MAVSEKVLKHLEQYHLRYYERFMHDVAELFGVYLELEALQDDDALWDLLQQECDHQRLIKNAQVDHSTSGAEADQFPPEVDASKALCPLNHTWQLLKKGSTDPSLMDKLFAQPGARWE